MDRPPSSGGTRPDAKMSSVGARGDSAEPVTLNDALAYLYNSEGPENVETMEVETPKEVVMQQIEDVRVDFVEVKKLIPIQRNYKAAEQKLTNLIFRLDDITTTDEEETQAMLILLAEIQECLKQVQNKEDSDFEVVTIGEQGASFVQPMNSSALMPESNLQTNKNGSLSNQASSVHNTAFPVTQSLPDDPMTLHTTGNVDSFEMELDADQENLSKRQSVPPDGQASKKQDCLIQVGDSPIVEEGQDSALQLLLQDAQGKFYLNKEALTRILSGVQDRKLVIVSIVGAFRRAKSFLVNFLLRYLKAGGVSNWMEIDSKLTGFPWRSGMGRVTTGILMWSKPFLIRDDTAVLLMDTQGSFDSQTSMEENTFIFSLSTMVSSVQIYNLHERIQMDDLQNLQYFLEFGRLMQDDCHTKSFQKLVLLVRDWMFPDALEYGYLGGKELLTQWFQGRAGQGTAEMVQTCFEQVKCCLLPHPGEAVTYSKNFTGALSDLRPEFVDQLKMFVESILDPKDLPAKKISGIYVTGEELQTYLNTYVEHLQSSSLKPKILFQALTNTCNERARKKALSFYVREMETQVKLTEDVVALHQSLQTKAVEQFDAASSLGGDKDTNPQRQFLLELLQDKFETLVAQHKKRKEDEAKEARYQACQQMSEAANRIGTKYRQDMDMQCVSADGLSPEKLQEIHDSNFKQALDGFVQYLQTYPLDVCRPYIDQAKLDMQGHFAICKVREEEKMKQKKEAELEKTRQLVQENYQKKMEQYGVEKGAVDDLQLTHEKASAQALDHLVVMDDGTDEFRKHLECAKQVINSRWRIYNSRNENLLKLHSDQEAMILTLLLKDAQRSYELAMVNLCNAKVSASELEAYHVDVAKSCVLEFEEKAKLTNPGKVADFVEQLEKELKVKFEDMEELHARKISEAREQENKRPSKANYAIGIDLGTTNCCVAVYKDGRVSVIRNNVGMNTTPSTVFFGDDGHTFGESAIYKGYDEPKNCISEMKRIIGRRFDDPTVQSLISRFCFSVNKDENGWPVVAVEKGEKRIWKPEEISSLVLGEMRRLASVHLDSEVFDAVVTIPAYFNELQREATKGACAQAGLNVLRIINEPTAAAIAYGIQEPSERPRKVLVFDFGGGTCDVSILQMEKNQYTVLSSHGDNKLGGEDFDDLLMDHLVKSFEKKHPGMKLDATDKRRLRHQCERAKRELGSRQSTEVVVKRITDSETSFRETITVTEFQSLINHLFPRIMNPVVQCLKDAKLSANQVNEVVLVGGSSCMKSVQNLLQKHFPRVKLHLRINPDEAIAYGAAIQAAISSGKYGNNPPIIKDITPISLGIEERGRWLEILIAKNTQLPASRSREFCTIHNYQSAAMFKVYQGENRIANQNTMLGRFELSGLRRALAEEVKFNVSFNIDVDGILVVSAVEIGTNNTKQIKITRANETLKSTTAAQIDSAPCDSASDDD